MPPSDENLMDTSSDHHEEQPAHQPSVEHHEVRPVIPTPPIHEILQPSSETQLDMEADISQLEAPTFTTINRGPPEPMLRLRWDHRVNLIGEKVINPMIHCCDKCSKPILIYGRMVMKICALLNKSEQNL